MSMVAGVAFAFGNVSSEPLPPTSPPLHHLPTITTNLSSSGSTRTTRAETRKAGQSPEPQNHHHLLQQTYGDFQQWRVTPRPSPNLSLCATSLLLP